MLELEGIFDLTQSDSVHLIREETEARRREIIQGVSGRFEQGVWLLSAVVIWSCLLVYCLSAPPRGLAP